MAKQTINIGASPNDGTGTPLRTAFDYTNQNFTELYTAVGPSGNNIVCPGSATITGNLTVDTNTFFVDSANNRVGIGTASPNVRMELSVADAAEGARLTASSAWLRLFPYLDATDKTKIQAVNGTNSALSDLTIEGLNLRFNTNAGLSYAISNASVHTWQNVGGVAGTAMTLNSTGLGVGVSPAAALHAKKTLTGTASAVTNILRLDSGGFGNTAKITLTDGVTSDGYITMTGGAIADQILGFGVQGVNQLVVNGSGNVGIGVTPNTWTVYKALQVNSASVWSTTGNDTAYASNVYYDGGYKFRSGSSDKACMYIQFAGQHQWHYTASAGTAGNTAAFTQAMTLDASGNLLVGTTSQLYPASIARLNVDSGTAGTATFKTSGGSAQATLYSFNSATTGDNAFITFGTEAAFTSRGSVTYNRAGGLVAYNTTSDYRAKDIIGPVSNSGSLIDSLKVYVGKMNGATIERPMLIAHEAQEVAPYAVTGIKDEVDADGKPKYQQMDASALVPLLIAEIQSLRTRVQTLETR